jgi:hypothetical protein
VAAVDDESAAEPTTLATIPAPRDTCRKRRPQPTCRRRTGALAETAQIAQMLAFLAESRRVSNRRMLDELGVQLTYPTMQAGIRASLAEMRLEDSAS